MALCGTAGSQHSSVYLLYVHSTKGQKEKTYQSEQRMKQSRNNGKHREGQERSRRGWGGSIFIGWGVRE